MPGITAADILAVIYAYLLAFIVLGLIAVVLTVVYRIVSRQVSAAPTPAEVAPRPTTRETPTQPTPQPRIIQQEVPSRPTTEDMVEKIAVAVAAVAAHLSALAGPPATATTQVPQVVVGGWVTRWRSQVAASPNEVSYLISTSRWR